MGGGPPGGGGGGAPRGSGGAAAALDAAPNADCVVGWAYCGCVLPLGIGIAGAACTGLYGCCCVGGCVVGGACVLYLSSSACSLLASASSLSSAPGLYAYPPSSACSRRANSSSVTAAAEADSRSNRCAVSAASFSFFFLRCNAFLDRPSVLPEGGWPVGWCPSALPWCESEASTVDFSRCFFDSILRRISSISAISRSAAASAALRSAACLSCAALVSAAA